MTMRIIFALFLIAHGLVTMTLATVPVSAPGAVRTPYLPGWWRADTDSAWPVSKLGLNLLLVRTAGWLLWLAALVLLTAAGLGLFGLPGLNTIWQALATAGAAVSLVLLVFYWHPWLALGVIINLGILLSGVVGWLSRWFML